LRRELDLPPVVSRPADAARRGSEDETLLPDPLAGIFGARGLEEPALVDQLLAVPGVHLIVDGYNVTKRGYGTLSLEAQRARLHAALGGFVGRFPGAEITCVWDGTGAVVRPVAVPVPRGLRVLFSEVGELADEVIVRLVRAEPPGRAIAVVTSDRAVADAVTAAGARVLGSDALLTRLERG
jgi:predicted RNA-binding protein with PIN domain